MLDISGVITVRPWLSAVGETYWNSTSTALTPCGTVDVEGVDVERIAHPLELLAVRGDLDAGDILDVVARAVSARHPLRIKQDEIAGAGDGHALVDPEDAARDVGRVDRQLDRAGIGNVARRRDRVDLGDRLRLAVLRRDDLRGGGAGQAGRKNQDASATWRIDANSLEIERLTKVEAPIYRAIACAASAFCRCQSALCRRSLRCQRPFTFAPLAGIR